MRCGGSRSAWHGDRTSDDPAHGVPSTQSCRSLPELRERHLPAAVHEYASSVRVDETLQHPGARPSYLRRSTHASECQCRNAASPGSPRRARTRAAVSGGMQGGMLAALLLVLAASPEPTPNMRITVAKLEASSGKAGLNKVAHDQLEALKGCYDLALKEEPGAFLVGQIPNQ